MKKEKGFTLVELLAVIVILAVILAIAIPSISNVISSSTKSSFESDAKMLLQQLEYKKLENDSFDVTTFNVDLLSSFNLSKDNYSSLGVSTIDNKPYIVIEGKNKWDGLKACGTRTNMKIVPITDTTTCENVTVVSDYDSSKGVNKPKLAQGMTPIKWNGTTWVNTTESDTDWYNYNITDKKWANAKTADGSFWVWIPRYIYKISSNWHTNTAGTIDVQFSKGIDDNWNKSVIGNIDTGTTANASNNKWTNHPAFTFGTGTELTGFWVAKFEPSVSNQSDACYTSESKANCDKTTLVPKIIPNAKSWRNITIGNMFTVSLNMRTNAIYGWGTSGAGIDTHMMKNTEWGAVAYLSKSNYGQGTNEIWINPANNFTTGCAGDSVSSASTTGCLRTYETTNGVKASTTGTIYGIYDMSGGSWEYISAYVNNGNSNLTTYGNVIVTANDKYKDVYAKGATDDGSSNYALTINQKGDAIYETSNEGTGMKSWFGDYSYMPSTSFPWFHRGGSSIYDSDAGAFAFNDTEGIASSVYGFRPVLAVSVGL